MSRSIADKFMTRLALWKARKKVRSLNAAAGIERWWVLLSPGHLPVVKDLGGSLLERLIGPSVRSVVLLRSGSSGIWRDSVVTVSRDEIGRILIHVDTRDVEHWSSLVEAGLLPEVLTVDGFERLVRGLRELPGMGDRWIGVGCSSFEELLARLALVESIERSLPEQEVELCRSELENPDLIILSNEVMLATYKSLTEGHDYVAIARGVDERIRVYKMNMPSPAAYEAHRWPILNAVFERPLSMSAWAQLAEQSEATGVLTVAELTVAQVEARVLGDAAICSN